MSRSVFVTYCKTVYLNCKGPLFTTGCLCKAVVPKLFRRADHLE